jgi:hypothetical protein
LAVDYITFFKSWAKTVWEPLHYTIFPATHFDSARTWRKCLQFLILLFAWLLSVVADFSLNTSHYLITVLMLYCTGPCFGYFRISSERQEFAPSPASCINHHLLPLLSPAPSVTRLSLSRFHHPFLSVLLHLSLCHSLPPSCNVFAL